MGIIHDNNEAIRQRAEALQKLREVSPEYLIRYSEARQIYRRNMMRFYIVIGLFVAACALIVIFAE